MAGVPTRRPREALTYYHGRPRDPSMGRCGSTARARAGIVPIKTLMIAGVSLRAANGHTGASAGSRSEKDILYYIVTFYYNYLSSNNIFP